jgi:methylated-DNA-[protein]-cysteine S-methyltransferase
MSESTSSQLYDAIIAVPFGRLGIYTEMVDASLMVGQLVYLSKDHALKVAVTDLAKEVERQCQAYFKNPQFFFELPLKRFGTNFQCRVWNEIEAIPCGETQTYGQLAQRIKSAPRAVGQACGSNPYPLIVPCHRVVSATGIGGFAHQSGEGFHRDVKQWLLNHEGAQMKGHLSSFNDVL